MNRAVSRVRLSVAVAAGKLTGASGRLFRIGGGAAWPGLIARRIDPNILKHTVGTSKAKKIVITGSNGKTTTARMIAALANAVTSHKRRVAQNRTGANLLHGVTAVAVHATNIFGRLDKDALIFEVDEATMPLVVPEIKPDVVIVTNIFRDQLDRFGELYSVAKGIDKVLEGLPAEATIILNGNDPQVAAFGANAKAKKLYFGLETTEVGTPVPEQSADVIRCLRCDHDLDYKVAYLSHLGLYRCPNCGYTLPKLDVAATQVQLAPDGEGPSSVGLITPDGEMKLRIPLPGLHNVYNAAAALAAIGAAGLSLEHAQTAFDGLKTAFGRMEKVTAGDKTIFLSFVKNPTSFNLVLRLIAQHPGKKRLYIAFSRTVVDGEDFAWLWDVDFEELTPQVASVMCSGNKAEEEALRVKYAGVPTKHITTNPDMEKALNAALANVQPGGTLHILCGYTPNQQLRRIMQKRGWVKHYWQE